MVYFLSDAHLGSRALSDPSDQQQRLVGLLNTMAQDATAIYMLGDMFDFWYEYIYDNLSCSIPRRKRFFTPFLQCLKQLTEKGIQVHYFIGNHDIWTFGWLARYTGVTVHRHPETVIVCGKSVYLAHGDGLIPSSYMLVLPPAIQKKIRAFMRLRAFFHNPVPQFLFRFMPPVIGDNFGFEWARRSRLKELRHPCPYKGEEKEELVLFAQEREAQQHTDYYVFGHRHIVLDLPLACHSRVLILGDCFRQWTYARMDEKGQMAIFSVMTKTDCN